MLIFVSMCRVTVAASPSPSSRLLRVSFGSFVPRTPDPSETTTEIESPVVATVSPKPANVTE